jgi:hypothetical protein
MAFEIPPGLMVSVSGVRGRVGEALTPDVVARFAAALGAYLIEPRVLDAVWSWPATPARPARCWPGP